MKSVYWQPVHVSEWLDRLYDVVTRAGTDRFSIVYRLYSTWDGPVRYVGRSDQPFGRASGHYSMIWFDGIHEELGARIVWVDFCYIKVVDGIENPMRRSAGGITTTTQS